MSGYEIAAIIFASCAGLALLVWVLAHTLSIDFDYEYDPKRRPDA